MIKPRKDKYSRARGGYSRFLDISCAKCSKHICYYQKDGPGVIKRMYLDRIIEINVENKKQLICPSCKSIIGRLSMYEKENRPIFLLPLGTISKKVIKQNQIASLNNNLDKLS